VIAGVNAVQITALRACHAKGWVLVDLHPSRVDVGRDGTVTIADWSSAVKYRDVVRAPKAKSLAVLAFRSAHVKTARACRCMSCLTFVCVRACVCNNCVFVSTRACVRVCVVLCGH
jgi:hypothetical protein